MKILGIESALEEYQEVFDAMLVVAKRALIKQYGEEQALEIQNAFRNDPVEIIHIASRDIHNAILKMKTKL